MISELEKLNAQRLKFKSYSHRMHRSTDLTEPQRPKGH